MTTTTEDKATRAKRRPVRLLLKLLRLSLLLVMVLFVAYHIADQILWRQLQQQREVFRERFGAVDFRDFVPAPPEPAQDAGRVYSYALHLIDGVQRQYGDWSVYDALVSGPGAFEKRGSRDDESIPSDGELELMIQEKMAALEGAFSVLREADALEQGMLMQFSELGKRPVELDHVRDIATCLAAKAIVEARAGRLESASAWLESGNHFIELLGQHPTLAVHMIRVGLMKVNLGALQAVLNATADQPDLGPTYLEALDRIAAPEVFVRGLVSEAWNGWPAGAPHATRLQYSMQLLKMGALTDRIIDTLAGPLGTNPAAALQQVEADALQLTFLFYYYPPILIPAYVRAAETYYDIPVCRDLSKLALALRARKVAAGAYPDQLVDLVPDYIDAAPVDPYTGAPYHYERNGDGFRLWRAGSPPRSRDLEIRVLK